MNESTDVWSYECKYELMGALVYDRMEVLVYEVWENEI